MMFASDGGLLCAFLTNENIATSNGHSYTQSTEEEKIVPTSTSLTNNKYIKNSSLKCYNLLWILTQNATRCILFKISNF